jgi:hypothetical protein
MRREHRLWGDAGFIHQRLELCRHHEVCWIYRCVIDEGKLADFLQVTRLVAAEVSAFTNTFFDIDILGLEVLLVFFGQSFLGLDEDVIGLGCIARREAHSFDSWGSRVEAVAIDRDGFDACHAESV